VAWKAVCPSVILLKKFYEFALELETALCDLLTVLCSPDMPAIQHLEKQQAITKQFAEILHFTLSFDDLKMTSPAIQNDFSYYRRTLNRRRMEDTSAAVAVLSDGVNLPDDVANRMSLFYANPTPMLNTLSGAAEKLLQEVGSFWSCFILCLSHLPVLISFFPFSYLLLSLYLCCPTYLALVSRYIPQF
jgi:hypothetical protein